MRISQYNQGQVYIRQGKSVTDIQELTGLSASSVIAMADGAKLPSHILIQTKHNYQRCPVCHAKTMLPCISCFQKEHPEAKCIEAIIRLEGNHFKPLNVTLDSVLLGEK